MTSRALFDALPINPDPHCNRMPDETIAFSVGTDFYWVRWGEWYTLGTPAYYANQVIVAKYGQKVDAMAASSDLLTETVFCLLGGYGVSAAAASVACNAVMSIIDSDPTPSQESLEELLKQPLSDGKKYRFPVQRSKRLAEAVARLHTDTPPADPLKLRDWLLTFNGIGPKTAAWITRNTTASKEVAIIDIWLVRALTANGIFKPEWKIERHYDKYESAFLQYAAHADVSPAALDMCIWDQARTIGQRYFRTIAQSRKQ